MLQKDCVLVTICLYYAVMTVELLIFVLPMTVAVAIFGVTVWVSLQRTRRFDSEPSPRRDSLP